MRFDTSTSRLRSVALLEGVSYLLLLFVAMPLKYLAGQPLAVRVVGMAHGLLFVWLMLLLFSGWRRGRSLRWAARIGIASLLPFGTLVLDRELRREDEDYRRAHGRAREGRWRMPRFLRFLLIELAAVLALAGLLEAGSYLLGSFPVAPDPLVMRADKRWRQDRLYDHLLFWKLAPDAEEDGIRINNVGLRGPDVPDEGAGEYRVLSLGESSTFAGSVAYEESYSSLVEQTIGVVGGERLRVINAGVPGYTIVQGYGYLLYHGLELDVDAVLLYFGHNDFLPVSHLRSRDPGAQRAPSGISDWNLLERRRRPLSRLNAWIRGRSNLARAIGHWTEYRSAEPPTVDEDAETTPAYRARVPEEDRERVLSLILEVCRERGIHLTVVVPWYPSFDEHRHTLVTFATAQGVPLVDLPRTLDRRGEDSAAFFADTVHPNARGHAAIAREIVEIVRPLWEAHRSGRVRD